jgi:hypothetical protein
VVAIPVLLQAGLLAGELLEVVASEQVVAFAE